MNSAYLKTYRIVICAFIYCKFMHFYWFFYAVLHWKKSEEKNPGTTSQASTVLPSTSQTLSKAVFWNKKISKPEINVKNEFSIPKNLQNCYLCFYLLQIHAFLLIFLCRAAVLHCRAALPCQLHRHGYRKQKNKRIFRQLHTEGLFIFHANANLIFRYHSWCKI